MLGAELALEPPDSLHDPALVESHVGVDARRLGARHLAEGGDAHQEPAAVAGGALDAARQRSARVTL